MAQRAADTTISPESIEYICGFIGERAAIVLDAGKTYLIQARLEPVARRHEMESIEDLVRAIRRGGAAVNGLCDEVVDALTTNETSFFRDFHPFETLKNVVLPALIQQRAEEKRLSIWCAASSSGQEPYTIAMILKEHFPQLHDWKITFLASDVSKAMLDRCRDGFYTKLEVNRGLPAMMLVKHFTEEGGGWQIKEDLRKMIDFRSVNLIGNWPVMVPMDLIFVRNVLIYFSLETKQDILIKMRKSLRPDGCLFLGSTETILQLDVPFERVAATKSGYFKPA